MKIDFLQELNKLKPQIWQSIEPYLPADPSDDFHAIIRDYPSRQGKYFRPGLILLANEMFGGNREQAILTAAAMQISEDWLLIHDDYMDKSEERRGRPTLNKLYGDEQAVNAGDALHVIMWKILSDNTKLLGLKQGLEIQNYFASMLLRTTEGQFTEVSWIRSDNLDVSEEEYLKMIDIKAGLYTVIGPLQLGAIIAGQASELENIFAWGKPLGRAFQIWDDVMNLTASTASQGKEQYGDILEGKRTLMLIHLLDNATESETQAIANIYNKQRNTKTLADQETIISLMNNHGSIDYARNIALNQSALAMKIFEEKTAHLPDTAAKAALREAITFVTSRAK